MLVIKNDRDEMIENLSKYVTKTHVTLNNREWCNLNMEAICGEMEQWAVQELDCGRNFCPTIVKELMQVELPKLIILDISDNNLLSIESLSTIHMPSLTQLSINGNKLHNINSLRKAQLPHISKLNISYNPIKEANKLPQVLMTMRAVTIQLLPITPLACENISWLCKVFFHPKSQLRIKSNGRIKQNNLYSKLKTRNLWISHRH